MLGAEEDAPAWRLLKIDWQKGWQGLQPGDFEFKQEDAFDQGSSRDHTVLRAIEGEHAGKKSTEVAAGREKRRANATLKAPKAVRPGPSRQRHRPAEADGGSSRLTQVVIIVALHAPCTLEETPVENGADMTDHDYE